MGWNFPGQSSELWGHAIQVAVWGAHSAGMRKFRSRGVVIWLFFFLLVIGAGYPRPTLFVQNLGTKELRSGPQMDSRFGAGSIFSVLSIARWRELIGSRECD